MFSVKPRMTSAYHPQSNGLDERTNQTLKRYVCAYNCVFSSYYHYFIYRCIVKLMNAHSDDWDLNIDPVLFAMRTSVQETTKYSPFFLMYGREARFPIEAEKIPTSENVLPSSSDEIDDIIARLRAVKEASFSRASENIKASQERQKKQYRKRKGLRKTQLQEGDLVLRMNMRRKTRKGAKLEDTWLGPYEIVSISAYGSCKLKSQKTGKELKGKVNVSQLKHYYAQKKQQSESTSCADNEEEQADKSISVDNRAAPVAMRLQQQSSKKTQAFICRYMM